MKHSAPLRFLLAVTCLCLRQGRAENAANPANVVEQIIVTAKKRPQSLINVPQTVDVLSGLALRRLDLVSFEDVQQAVSGLQLNDNGGRGQSISLRGITYDPDTTANPTVDTYVNEVPISQTSLAFQDLFDMDSVQVVRGPQGTLRGRTSPAGAILLDTKRPDFVGLTGYIDQEFSDNNLLRTQLAVGAAIIPERLSVRVAGLFDQNNLYETRSAITGKKDFNLQHGARISVEAHPTDALEVFVMHQESNDRTRQLFGVSGAGVEGAITPADNLSLLAGPYTFYNRTSLTTLQAHLHFDNSVELNYVGGYQAIRDEFQNYAEKGGLFQGFNTGSQLLDQSVGSMSHELRYQSVGDARFGYMGGLYFLHQDANAHVFTPSEIVFARQPAGPYPGVLPVANINANVAIPQLETDYAIFTDETYKLTPDDIVEGGLRWQFEKQYRASSYAVMIPSIFGGGSINQQLISAKNQHEEYRAWTGLASYTHHFTPDVSVYASYGQSFRPGGVVLGITLPLPENFLLFKPETSYDFEVGAKARLYKGKLQIAGDVYNQAYTNYIGRENNIFTRFGYQSITTNGNAVARGFEASAAALITPDWHLNLNATFDNSRYDAARLPCNDFAGLGQPNTRGVPRVTGSGITSTCVTSGPLGAPNWFVTTSSEYTFSLMTRLQGFVRVLYSFTPRNRLLLQATNQDPRSLLNLYLGAHGAEPGWEGFIFVKNVLNLTGSSNPLGEQFDSGFTTAGSAVNFDTRYASSVILHPREIGISLSYRF